MRTHCILFTGSSGAGKSTMLHRCAEENWGDDVEAIIIPKVGTRMSRGGLDSVERTTMDVRKILEMKEQGRLGAHYQMNDVHYGILSIDEASSRLGNTQKETRLFLQCTSPAGIEQIRAASTCAVHSCLLRVDPMIASQRLAGRSDELTPEMRALRVAIGEQTNQVQADLIVDANQPLETVYSNVRDWIRGIIQS